MCVWVKVVMTPTKSGLKFAPSRSATLFCAAIIVEIVVSGSKGFGCLLLAQLHLEQSQRRRLTGSSCCPIYTALCKVDLENHPYAEI